MTRKIPRAEAQRILENPGDLSLGKDRRRCGNVELIVQPVELAEEADHFLHVAVDIHEGLVGGLVQRSVSRQKPRAAFV